MIIIFAYLVKTRNTNEYSLKKIHISPKNYEIRQIKIKCICICMSVYACVNVMKQKIVIKFISLKKYANQANSFPSMFL